MKYQLRILAASWLLLASCSGTKYGIVYDANGNTVAEIAVRLVSVNDQGEPTATLATAITDSQGRFSFSASTLANASLQVIASLTSGEQRGFFAGREQDIPVHPLTGALVALIMDITKTSGGRSTDDFSSTELRALTSSLFTLDTSQISLTDSSATKDLLRDEIGRSIAEASGGGFSSLTTEELEGDTTSSMAIFAADTDICLLGAAIFVLQGGTFRFDIEEDGTICGGTHASLNPILSDPSLYLQLPGESYFTFGGSTFPTAAGGSAPLEDEREVVLGPYSLTVPGNPGLADDIEVGRKIYVPVGKDYIRYLDIFTNTGASNRILNTIVLSSFLALGNDSQILTFDSAAENGVPGLSDRYLVAYDAFQDAPTAGFLYQDNLARQSVDQLFVPGLAGGAANEITYIWEDVIVPANQSRILLHYVWLDNSRSTMDLDEAMQALLNAPDMDGMSLNELASLANFTPSRGTVLGEAGSVIGLATVTGKNQRSDEEVSVSAREEGSFALPLDTLSNDTITLTATDGLSTTITVP